MIDISTLSVFLSQKIEMKPVHANFTQLGLSVDLLIDTSHVFGVFQQNDLEKLVNTDMFTPKHIVRDISYIVDSKSFYNKILFTSKSGSLVILHENLLIAMRYVPNDSIQFYVFDGVLFIFSGTQSINDISIPNHCVVTSMYEIQDYTHIPHYSVAGYMRALHSNLMQDYALKVILDHDALTELAWR